MSKTSFSIRVLFSILALIVATEGVGRATLAPLPIRKIGCRAMQFESILNSNHIYFESRFKDIPSLDVSVDKTKIAGEEIYLNYIKKECPPGKEETPAACIYSFAVYRMLPDKSIPQTNEYLWLDFANNEIIHDAHTEGNPSGSVPQKFLLPESCRSLAQAYWEREQQLNKAYSKK